MTLPHVTSCLLRQRFDVEEEVDGACVDYLSVHDGSSTSDATILDTLCDTMDETFNLTSSGRHVTFHFVSDENARLRGFEAVYVASPTVINLL